MPDVPFHLFIACVLGAFVLGYLLAEWYFDDLLRKQDQELAECQALLEELGASS